MQKRGLSYLAAMLLSTVLFRPVYACGLCHEDDRAAVYSYAADQKAKAQPDQLEFAVLKVVGPLPASTVQHLTSWLGARKGVDPSTIKISAPQKSIGFVFEKTESKDSLLADLNKQFPELKIHFLKYD